MVVDYIIEDKDFGKLYIKRNARAVRYTFRPAHDGGKGILVTVPRLFSMPDLQRALEEMRPRLLAMMEKDAVIEQRKRQRPQPTVQDIIDRKIKTEQMRIQAWRELPPKLMALAQQYGFKVKEVKINSARGRWGSCVSHKKGLLSRTEYSINLSLYCVLLPEHLLRLIMLHELTHIHHMDHSPAFHAELDSMLGGKEKELERELKEFTKGLQR